MPLVRVIAALALAAVVAGRAEAQPQESASQNTSSGRRLVNVVEFLGGAGVGLAFHEGSHLLFDAIFDAHPGVKRVELGPLPFFAITHRGPLSPRREFVISSAGLWAQHGTSEIILTHWPGLENEHKPFLKGVLAFNLLTSMGYAGAAFARAGPYERDTRGMAEFLSIDERWVGTMLLAPALLDGYRYFHPRVRWARWGSRATKVAIVALAVRKSGRRERP